MNISVCMTTFNGEMFLKDQLDSIIPQLSNNDELLISDDGSTDNTLSVLKNYQKKYSNITIYNNSFGNTSRNFNFILSKADNELVFLADQDDLWALNRVEIIKKRFKLNQQLLLLVNDCQIFKDKNTIIADSFFKLRKSRKGILKNFAFNSYIGCCMVIRKKLLLYALPIPKNIPMHDLWIGMIAEIKGDVEFLDESLVKYRRHNCNVSFEINKSKHSLIQKITNRIKILFCLIIFFILDSGKIFNSLKKRKDK